MGDVLETENRIRGLEAMEGNGPQGDGKRPQTGAGLPFLSRTAMELVAMSPDDDIHQFIAERLSELVPEGAVMVNSFDEGSSTLRLRALRGVGKEVHALLKVLGKHPIGLSAPISEEARGILSSGKLERMPAGLYELASGGMRKEVSRGVEKLLGSGSLYAIGLVCEGHLYGSATVLNSKNVALDNVPLMEAFVRQASVALHRWSTEQALRRAYIELETRLAERTRELADADRRLRFEVIDRQQVEEKLHQERATLNKIVDLNPHAISTYDARGHYVHGNQAFLELFGGPFPADYSLFTDPILEHNGCRREVSMLALGQAVRIPKLWYNPRSIGAALPDRPVFVRGVAFPVMGKNGTVDCIVAMHEDITARKKVEEELLLKNSALASSVDAIALSELGGNLSYVNAAFLSLWGYDDERQVIGRAAVEFWQAEEEAATIMRAVMEKGGWRGEAIAMRKDGTAFVAELAASLVANGDGQPTCLMGSFVDVTERKRLAEMVRESEELFRGMLGSATVGMYIIQGGKFIYVNQQFEAITGFTFAELSGRDSLQHVHPDDKYVVRKKAREQLKGQSDTPYEYRFMRKDGRLLWIMERVASIVYKGQLAAVGSFMDVTELKSMQRELAKSEERYRSLVETASAGIVATNVKGEIEFVNEALCAMMGYTPEELVGRDLADFLHPDDRRAIRNAFRDALNGVHGPPLVEFRVLHKDGYRLWFQSSPTVLTHDSETVGFTAVIHDVTERKLAEERFRSLVDNASDVIVILDSDGTIQYMSPAIERMQGYRPEELVGENGLKLAHPDDVPGAGRMLAELVRSPGSVARAEVRIRHKDGSWRTIDVVGRNLLDDPAVGAIVANFRDVTERGQAERELRQSEEKLRLLIESVTDGIAAFDRNGVYTEVNQRLVEMHGLSSKEEMLGKTVFDFTAERDRGKGIADMERALRDGSVLQEEYAALRADGTEFLCEVSGTLLRDATGHPTGYIATVRDITERKQAEVALRASEERYRVLVENANDAIIVAQDGMLKFFNRKAVEITGYTGEELAAKPFIELIHPDDRRTVVERHLRRLQGEEFTHIYPFRVVDRDGKVRWVEIRAVLVNWEGKPATLNFLSDITERKNAEEELRQSEERFRALFENATEAVAILDAEGTMVYESSSVERMLGYTPEELVGRRVLDLIHPDDVAEVAAGLAERLAGDGKTSAPQELRLRHKDGSWRWVEGVARNLLDNPYVRGIVANYRDITERHEADAALRDSERLYRLVADNATDVIWTMDLNLRFTYVSPSFGTLLGYGYDEAMALAVEEFLTPESLGEARRALAEAVAPDKQGEDLVKSRTLQLELVRRDGSTVWTENKITLLLDSGGRRTGIFGVARNVTERKAAEQALRESEERFRRFVQNAPDIIFRWSVERGLEYVSPRALEVTGYTAEELMTDPMLGSEIARAIELDLDGGGERAGTDGRALHPRELAFVRKDGSEAYLELRPVPIVDDDGTFIGCEGILRDVTEYRWAEEQLRRSEEFSTSLLANSPTPILVINPDTSVRYVNPALEELTGFSDAELVGTTPPYPWWAEEAVVRAGWDPADAITRGAQGLEQLCRKKSGERFWIELTSTPVVRDGELTYYVATWIDVTERKRAGEALRHSEYKYRTALESARDGVLILDTDGNIVDANRTCVASVGYEYKEQLIGRNVFDIVASEVPEEITTYVTETLKKQGYITNFEVVARARDGKEIPVEANMSQLLDERGQVSGAILVIRDVTERKRAQEEILRYAKRLEALHAISVTVSQTPDLDEMLNAALEKVVATAGVDGGFIHLYEPERRELACRASFGAPERLAAAAERMEVSEEAMQLWLKYPAPAFRRSQILANTASSAQLRAVARQEGLASSAVSVPLWSKSVMHGGLTLLSRKPRHFSHEELDLLKAMCNEIAVGIENAKLLERTRQLSATDELTGLHNRRQFFEVLEAEMNRVQRYGGSFALAMLDLDEFKEYNDRFGHTNGDAVLRSVAQTLRSELRKPDMAFRYGGDEFAVILPETDAERARGIVDRVRATRLESLGDGNLGSDLRLSFSAGIAQFPDNAETADGLVFLADTALYRSKRSGGNRTNLVADLGEVGADVVDSATMDQVYALAATVDARDPHTYGHSKRVATIAEVIGKGIGLQPKELADLRAAALLHDIGKVGVPDAILTKPAKPDGQEWKVLKRHPSEGAKIVGYVKELEKLVPLIRHHHEWYDGSGYPDGLKGEDIPRGARIISVADAFDTMTTARPYREVVTAQEACEELRRCTGTQFEGSLVEALCRALRKASVPPQANALSSPRRVALGDLEGEGEGLH